MKYPNQTYFYMPSQGIAPLKKLSAYLQSCTPRRTERIPVISATKRATKTCVSDKGILVKKRDSIQKKSFNINKAKITFVQNM